MKSVKKGFGLLAALTLGGWLLASPPAWWAQRGVTTNATPNDYAAANIGQLKHMAKQASVEMEARLPGGAGPSVTALVASWSQPPGEGVVRNDFAVLTQGQLKAVAKVFYDRLAEEECTGHPLASGQTYPWTADTADDASFAPANIGQLKRVFSFDLYDNDADGLPDSWERKYLGTLAYGPTEDPGSVGRTLSQSHQQNLSPWPTPSVADGLRAWFRADLGITKDVSNKVSQWTDVSGNGAHVRQTANPGARPTYATTAMHGKPAIEFGEPTNVLLSSPATDIFSGSDNLSVVMVLKPNGDQANEMNVLDFQGAAFRLGQAFATNQLEALWWDPEALDFGGGGAVLTIPGVVQVFTLTKDELNLRGYLNGQLRTDEDMWWLISGPLQQGPRSMALGAAVQGTHGFNGQIAEVLIYNRVLTSVERSSIEAALLAKYVDPDVDADGLPDAWEDQFVGSRAYGPSDDPGGVGRTLLVSYQQGLNPWPVPTVADGLRAWYRADKGVTKDQDNHVTQWTDVSGAGMHVVQNTETMRPRWVASAINGKPALVFGETMTALQTSALFDVFGEGDDVTIFMVLKAASEQSESSTLLDFSNVTFRITQTYNPGQFQSLWLDPSETNYGSGGAATFTTGVPQLYTLTKSGTHIQSRLGGLVQSDDDLWWLPSAPLQQGGRLFTLGAMTNQLGNFTGQIAEVMVYNRALTNAERQEVEAALSARYFSDPNADDDGDGLTNGQEAALGTNPNSRDSDGDGLSDGEEVALGTNALVADLDQIPAHIAGRNLHLKADAGVSLDANGKVTAWADQSAAANNLTQAAAANRPVLQASSINGKPALLFSGSQFLTAPIAPTLKPANITAVAVYKLAATGNYSRLIALPFRAPGSWSAPYFSWSLSPGFAASGSPYMDLGIGAAWNPLQSGVTPALGTTVMLLGSYDGNRGRVYVNGELKNSTLLPGVIPYDTATDLHVGNDPLGEFLNGSIAELLVYDRALTDDEQFLLGIYLHQKYQLPGVVVPSAPTGVVATSISSSRVNVVWQPPATTSPVMRYVVERRTGTGPYTKLAELSGVQGYLDATVSSGQTYTYRISARSYAGTSAGTESNSVTVEAGGLGFSEEGLQLWLRADAGVDVDGSGKVSRWKDISGNGRDVTQTTAANQPVLQSASINGLPGVRFAFDGSAKFLSGSANAALKPATITVFSVHKLTGGGNSPTVIAMPHHDGSWTAPNPAWALHAGYGNPGNRQPFGAVTIGATSYQNFSSAVTALNATSMVAVTYDGSASQVYVNGILRNAVSASGALTYGTVSTFFVGSNPGFEFMDGDIAEIMVFDRALAPSERQAVSSYLNQRYGYSSATTPGAPTGLVAESVSSTQVSLRWTAPVGAEEIVYQLERKTGAGAYSKIASLSGVAAYLDATVQGGLNYTYRVKATTIGGASGYSNEAAVTTPANAPAVKTTGLRLWVNADMLAPGSVATWTDFSSNRKDLTQSDAAKQPVAVAGAINGHSVVRFDEINDGLNLNTTTLAGMSAGEVFIVHKTATSLPPNAASGANGGLWNLGAGPAYFPDSGGAIYESFGTNDPIGGTASGVPEQPLDAYHLYNVSAGSGSIMNVLNGRVHVQRSANAVVFNTTTPVLCFGGIGRDVAEVMIYDHTLAPAERDAVAYYLATKYALVAAPVAPTGLSATGLGATRVSLEWQSNLVPASTRFAIERKDGTGEFALLAEVSDVLSFVDGTTTASTAYTYRVKARTIGGESAYSVETTVTTPTTTWSMPLAGIRLWLKADSLIASDTASIWRDQSGARKHLVQNTAARRPLVLANGVGGKPVARFDDINDSFSLDPTTLVGMTSGEIFVVHRTTTPLPPNAAGGTNGGLWNLGGGPALYPVASGVLSETFGTNEPLSSVTPEQALDAYHVYDVSAQSGSLKTLVNGRLHSQRDTNTVVFNTTDPVLCFGGIGRDVAELIIYDRTLTVPEREAVGRYLASRYGLVAVPAVPTGLAAVTLADTQVSLTWRHALAGASTRFVIERRSDVGSFAPIAEIADVRSFIDATADPDTTYVYRIRARTLGGESGYSNESVATTTAGGGEMPLVGIRLWLKADSLVTGGMVATWRDQSGLRKDAFQGNATKRPVSVPGAINGQPVARFDEVNDSFDLDPTTLAGMTAGEVFIVHKTATALPPNATGGANGGLWNLGGAPSFYPAASGGLFESFGTTSALVSGAPDQSLDSYHLYNVSAQNGAITSSINGRLHAQRDTNTVAFNTTAPALCFGGIGRDVAEVIIYDRALTGAERESVGRYLNGKYQLSPSSFDSVGNFDYDSDGDGLSNAYELAHGLNPYNRDSDGDGMPDGWEVAHGLNPLNPTDAGLDPDGDGFTNLEEYLAGTNPQVPAANEAGASVKLRIFQPAQR